MSFCHYWEVCCIAPVLCSAGLFGTPARSTRLLPACNTAWSCETAPWLAARQACCRRPRGRSLRRVWRWCCGAGQRCRWRWSTAGAARSRPPGPRSCSSTCWSGSTRAKSTLPTTWRCRWRRTWVRRSMWSWRMTARERWRRSWWRCTASCAAATWRGWSGCAAPRRPPPPPAGASRWIWTAPCCRRAAAAAAAARTGATAASRAWTRMLRRRRPRRPRGRSWTRTALSSCSGGAAARSAHDTCSSSSDSLFCGGNVLQRCLLCKMRCMCTSAEYNARLIQHLVLQLSNALGKRYGCGLN